MMVLKVILSVLLFILKVIGIILLALLGLLILILLTVLFVPVRYKAEGNISIGENNTGEVKAGFSWLLHIISIKVWVKENKLQYYGKLFGIKMVDSNNPRPKREKKKKKTGKKDTDNAEKIEKLENTEGNDSGTEQVKGVPETENKEETTSIEGKEKPENNNQNDILTEKLSDTVDEYEKPSDTDYEKKEPSDTADENNDTEAENAAENGENHKYKKSISEKLTEKYDRLSSKIQRIKLKFTKICDNIKNMDGTRQSYVDFLTAEESRTAISQLKMLVIKILKHIMPVRLKADVRYGFTEPDVTGQVFGVLCILLNRYGEKIIINPQFTDVEKTFVCGKFKCRGRIRAAVLLVNAIKIYKVKRLKEFIAFAKGKGKKNGREQ